MKFLKFLVPTRKANVIYTYNSMECFLGIWQSLWRSFLESLHVDTTQIRLIAGLEELETMDASEIWSKRLNAKEVIFPKENGEFIFPVAEEWKKVHLQYCCSSGLGNEWLGGFYEMLLLSAKHSRSVSVGKTPYERRFGIPLNGPIIPFGAMVEYHPISSKDQSRLHQFGATSLARYVFRFCIKRDGNLERRHYGRRHWRIGGDGRIGTPRQKAQCKGRGNAAKKWKFHIPSRRWNSQNIWRRTASENIHQPGTVRNDEKNKTFFKENQMNYILQPHFKKTQPGMLRKLKMTSGRSQEDSYIVIALYQESNCTCRKM